MGTASVNNMSDRLAEQCRAEEEDELYKNICKELKVSKSLIWPVWKMIKSSKQQQKLKRFPRAVRRFIGTNRADGLPDYGIKSAFAMLTDIDEASIVELQNWKVEVP
eukprot:6864443-Lingulodinium_polyedra.AAC.1